MFRNKKKIKLISTNSLNFYFLKNDNITKLLLETKIFEMIFRDFFIF